MEFQNVAAIVTGGASGLGEGAARALAAAGCKIAIFDLQKERGEAVAKELGGIFVECDVSSAASAEAAFAKAREAHGLCGVVVNCAGVATAGKILGREGVLPLENFSKVVQVNLIGTFNILRLAAADMAQRAPNADGERGVIINTASIAAYEGQVGQAAYSASKGGVVALTLQAARELAREGIRVNTIAPGLFMTPMIAGMPQEVQDSLAATLVFPKRLGKPEEFGMMVDQMVRNPVLNGEVIRLDSALRMAPR
ncbi:SDR family NAD(P)-dependent oxidoreductase (plasmid) [Marinobacter sp. M3C]|jgi:NAD(P)-dependent dehydrogenase (short-subunit alcohol dehydrogenase family)|uniref:SDR family NAD(P)-dependent oxidoreductase n=1 Tax=unclassified Marinobacter TaxID=83889 RepID=UPI0020100015|nr:MULTISPECIES: SDR family NAD(P)-dependent oxidoreductase [unclassified Marinobacter]MCL1479418.1 SDR family NAD(P)-dependent oxidoreductase [Marinobacter sp.]MCL1482487.1 SDR family NAD(P)-dependent oxidoreductase [Marinobacter sp.]MCL1488597.1 SDR family NAD(P)-dependent oxidoreductase [Marinobacter sp.]UQG54558.1 SDR family NAD(P)-dependent oxidoreductase [Marinobacter sp. M4C]UQG60067.1 SDR family NAD(P)-dependent oxidoreductase [Marinobacter sp. M3C]